jgi:hypothetical protein
LNKTIKEFFIMEAALLAAGASAGTASTVGTVMTAIGTLSSVMGAISGGSAANQAAQMQADVYARQAAREREMGALSAKRLRAQNEQVAASQRALLASGGRDMSTGSALLIQEDLAEEGEFNALLAENNTDATISSLRAQEVMERAKGRNAQTASYFRAGSALLKGGKVAFG